MTTESPVVDLTFRGRRIVRDRALVMAIVNRTPDSFYDNGVNAEERSARASIAKAVADGADLIDLGGVPASPGPEVTVREEIDRVVPTVEWARSEFPDLVISVDTWRHEAAAAMCEAGADLLNDNWTGADPEMPDVAAHYGTGYVCAHTNGLKPRTDPYLPRYDDVVTAIIEETTGFAEAAVARGVPREGILLDPAIDFNKTTWHGLELLRRIDEMAATGWPVLVAMSNKGFVSETLDVEIGDRVIGTLAATAHAAGAGAAMFRAHQARETRQVVEMVASIKGTRPPVRPLQGLV